MTHPSASARTVRLAQRMYDIFLGLYPAGFRADYEQEIRALFEVRCRESYEAAGTLGMGRWLLKILAREVASLYKEYLDMMQDLFPSDRDARKMLRLGVFFLAGTWLGLFFTATGLIAGLSGGALPGTALVLTNALLVARSLAHSERMEYAAGMAAMANIFLIAGLMAVQSGLGSFPLAAVALQTLLIGLHGWLLWQLRGEDLTRACNTWR